MSGNCFNFGLDDDILDDLYDILDDSDDSSSNVEVGSKETEYYQPIPKPKILRGDIRRCYSNMLANVVNSGDFPLLYGMFDSFCSPEIEQVTVKHLASSSIKVIRQGIPSVITLWYSILTMEPDVMVALDSTEVHLTSSSNCSRIVSRFKYSGTRVYALPNSNEESNSLPVQDHGVLSPLSPTNHPTIPEQVSMEMIINSMENMKRFLPLLKSPTPCTNDGYIVLYTDDNKFISKIEIETHEIMSYL